MSGARSIVVAAAVAAGACAAGPARAQPDASLALDPAPAGDRALLVESADVRGAGLVRARLLADVASEPLVLWRPDQRQDRVVERQIWLHALVSVSVAHRLLAGVDVPAVLAQSGADATAGSLPVARAPGGASLGDVRATARLRLLGEPEGGGHLAIAGALWLPTAREGAWAGDGSVRGRGAAVVGGVHGRFAWAIEAGLHARPGQRLAGLLPTRVATSLTGGAAAGWLFDAAGTLRLGPELRADLAVADGAVPFDPRGSVAHALVGARWTPRLGDLEITSGFGPGLARGAGDADWRALLGIGWSPEQKPPAPDRDGDGVPDRGDACVALPGVPSADPAMHGCPEAPRDLDGDSIPDEFDACPLRAGVPTGLRRTHGCPERPIVAEREPPAPPPVVERRIAIADQVRFETASAVLRPESDAVLAGVARTLAAHPEIELVEVQGHTDTTGTEALNRELSQSRAAAVVRRLVELGVAPARLVPRGYGYSRPIADEATEAGRQKNRRVDFVILRVREEAREAP